MEQGISLLGKLLEGQGRVLSEAASAFPDHLRFGTPTAAARTLAKAGIRHRHAAILVGATAEISGAAGAARTVLFEIARQVLQADEAGWRARLGILMYENVLEDVR